MRSLGRRRLHPAPRGRRRQAGMLLAGLTLVTGVALLNTSRPVAATGLAVGNLAAVPNSPLCTLVPNLPLPLCTPVPPTSIVPPAVSSILGSNPLPGSTSPAATGPSGTTGPAGTRSSPPGRRSPGRVSPAGTVSTPRAARLRLPTIAKLPASAPFGPGVVAKTKAILDLGPPPAVAPLEPLAGLSFASSPVFWPLLVVLDVLALIGVALLARRAWSRREPT